MAEILSQEEIEALLASLSSDGTEVTSSKPKQKASAAPKSSGTPPSTVRRDQRGHVAYEIYDFRRPDKFAKDQLRTLQMLHETFARLFASSLSAYLRVPVHVDLISVEQVPYEEYIRSLSNSIINVFSMAPLTGQAILEVELNVILCMIDRLLGGPGSVVKTNSVLTDIEKALTDSIINRALKDFRTAWEGIAQFNPKRETMETQAQFVQIVPPNDVVVSILFEVKVGDLRGAMSICIPYLLLKPITGKLSAQRWFSSSLRKNVGKHAPLLAHRIAKTYLTCVVRLGTASLTVKQLLELKEGDIIPLNRKQNEEVDVLIGEKVKFHAQPGIRGKKLAIHITRPETETDTDMTCPSSQRASRLKAL